MKDALVVFCGCQKMRNVLSSTMTPRMQTITILHASILAREFRALVRITHNATKHAAEEEEKLKDKANKLTVKKQEEQLRFFHSVCIMYHRLRSRL